MEIVTRYARLREDNKNKVKKGARLHGIPKLEDANKAGTKESAECTLIVTEGDSAKALAVAGLSVVGRDLYGVYPVRGKFLNVRDATEKRMAENQEILELKRILGLQSGADYAALPTSITIPAGQSAAAMDMLPLHDSLTEGDETFKVMLVPTADYSTGHPNKASILIEDRITPDQTIFQHGDPPPRSPSSP